ncbi:MAG: translocation/assembly module TamB domain-containing protein, partial [Gammaproteobacteria bacterium]
MKKRFLLAVLVLVLAFPAGLVGLMSTEAGSRFLLQAVFWLLPAEVSVKTVEGRLLDRLALHEFAYQTDAEKIALQRLLFVWEPSRLFSGKLKIDDIHLDKLDVQLPETAEPEKADGFDINAKMKLPLDIVIENLLLTDAVIRQDGRRQQLDKLLLSAFTENGRLTLAALDVNAPPLTATAKGRMELGGGYPFKLTADWQLATQDHGLWQAAASVDGDFHEMSFNHRLSSPFVSVAQGRLKNLQDKPSLTLRVDWQKLSWPFTKAAPEMSSEQGYFELAGRLDDYRMTLDAELARPSLPPGHLTFKGKGGEKSLSITGLELQSTAGQFRLSGDVVWNGATMFDLTAAGRQFNPAVLVPELPGSLTFNTRLKGKMDGASLSQLEADIDEFSGKLRGNPVSAGGTLVWTGNQLLADALKLFAGKNKIALNGVLGPEKAEFDVAVDAPDLAALWPDLGGSLKGEGKVQGTLKKPEVSLNAKGNGLRFAEHGAERITVDIDYHAGTEKTSRMQLSASGIETGARQIEQLRISGTGTLEKHRFTADISSSDGELASVLNGYLKDGEW